MEQNNANQNIAAGLLSIAQAIKVSSLGVQQDWQPVTFANSWVNYGGTFSPAAYMKDTMGFVHLRGLIKTGTIGFAAFTLPVGYRPAYDLAFAVNSNSAFGVVQAIGQGAGAGQVIPLQGNNAFVYLEGITFKAEA